MKSVAATLAIGTMLAMPGSAHARELVFHLRAIVPVMCQITDIAPVDLPNGELEVVAMCNADSFRLVLGGDLAVLPIQSANAMDASLSVTPGGIQVRPTRPGRFRFRVNYDADLTSVQAVSANLDII